MKSKIAVLITILTILFGGCRTIYVPGETVTVVKDSIVIQEHIDTVEVQLPPVKVKDYSALGDTLKLDGRYEKAWAAVDADREMLVGGIETTDVPVKTIIKWKDKIEYRDSIRIEEKPVPYPVEKIKYKVPWIFRILSLLGLASLCYAGLKLYLKFKGLPIGK